MESPETGPPETLSADELEMIYEFVDDNLASPIDAADIAESCGFPQASLANQFELAVGHSLALYIMEQRVKQAQRLMEGPVGQTRTMVHIADACGFSDVREFERHFGRLVGISPVEFKNRFAN